MRSALDQKISSQLWWLTFWCSLLVQTEAAPTPGVTCSVGNSTPANLLVINYTLTLGPWGYQKTFRCQCRPLKPRLTSENKRLERTIPFEKPFVEPFLFQGGLAVFWKWSWCKYALTFFMICKIWTAQKNWIIMYYDKFSLGTSNNDVFSFMGVGWYPNPFVVTCFSSWNHIRLLRLVGASWCRATAQLLRICWGPAGSKLKRFVRCHACCVFCFSQFPSTLHGQAFPLPAYQPALLKIMIFLLPFGRIHSFGG